MAKEQMSQRQVRVGTVLWEAAKWRADQRNETVSEAIRRFLAWYVDREDPHESQMPARPRIPYALRGKVRPVWHYDHWVFEDLP